MKYVFSGMSFLVRGECGIGSRSSHSVNRTEAHVTIFRVAQRVGKNAADLPIYGLPSTLECTGGCFC